jgi:hypothetical protein
MTERNLGVTIDVKRDIVMFHTVLCVDASKAPVAVAITTNPLDHRFYAQVVMHKTRSHNCAVQVARYVRRTFGIEEPVATHRTARPVEAMIGYACTRSAQHAPTESTPGWGVFQHIAATPISELLKEVADGHNAARTRYVVYEVRSASREALRSVTHRFPALERRYREAPPDTLVSPDLVQISRHPTHEEAMAKCAGFGVAGEGLWTRKPSAEYMRKVLHATPEDILWTHDGSPALRTHYVMPSVCVGPHVYTEYQVRHVLEHGVWPPNGNSIAGRAIIAQLA